LNLEGAPMNHRQSFPTSIEAGVPILAIGTRNWCVAHVQLAVALVLLTVWTLPLRAAEITIDPPEKVGLATAKLTDVDQFMERQGLY
jgi:hypothetical protein